MTAERPIQSRTAWMHGQQTDFRRRGPATGWRVNAVLGCGWREDALDLAKQQAFHSEYACFVQEGAHLGSTVAESAPRAEDDGVRVNKLAWLGHVDSPSSNDAHVANWLESQCSRPDDVSQSAVAFR